MKKMKGNVTFDPSVDYSSVEEITGSLNCRGVAPPPAADLRGGY